MIGVPLEINTLVEKTSISDCVSMNHDQPVWGAETAVYIYIVGSLALFNACNNRDNHPCYLSTINTLVIKFLCFNNHPCFAQMTISKET